MGMDPEEKLMVRGLMATVADLQGELEDVKARLAKLEAAPPGASAGGASVEAAAAALAAAAAREEESRNTVPQLCVHCGVEFKPCDSAEGECHFHKGKIEGLSMWKSRTTCCKSEINKAGYDWDAWEIALESQPRKCGVGRHRAAHHDDFPYLGRNFHAIKTLYAVEQEGTTFHSLRVTDAADAASEQKGLTVGTAAEGDELHVVFYVYPAAAFSVTAKPAELDAVAAAAAGGGAEVSIKLLAGKNDAKVPWSVEAWWVVQAGAVVGVRGEVQVSSGGEPAKFVAHFAVEDGGRFAPGAVETSGGPGKALLPADEAQGVYELPAAAAEGPTLDHLAEASEAEPVAYEVEVSGGCALTAKLADGGSEANQFFNSPLVQTVSSPTISLCNPTDGRVGVVDVATEFKSADGTWYPCVGSGGKPGCRLTITNNTFQDLFQFDRDKRSFTVHGHTTADLVVEAMHEVAGAEPYGTNNLRSRIHHALPSPLACRVTVTDEKGGKIVAVFEHANKPLQLRTPQTFPNLSGTMGETLTCYADDQQTLERSIHSFVASSAEGCWIYKLSTGTSYFVHETKFEAMVHAAVEAGAADFEWEEYRTETTSFHVLVDLERRAAWGVRLGCTTATSSATAAGFIHKFD